MCGNVLVGRERCRHQPSSTAHAQPIGVTYLDMHSIFRAIMVSSIRLSSTACKTINTINRSRRSFYFPDGRLQPRVSTANLPTKIHVAPFSTDAAQSFDKKKSPHSKLLRVCSNRNINLHFAAIEADLLQLNWEKAMSALVDDWMKQNKWSQFSELESNVRSYVQNNLPFLVSSWKKEQKGFHDDNAGMQLQDRIRMCHFPYEQVVSAVTKHAISGPVSYGTNSKLGIQTSEIEARGSILLDACKMLSSMTDFKMDQQVHTQYWTTHHESCSTCFRLIVSAWFLMSRRAKNTNLVSNIGDDSSIEEEMYNQTKNWIAFCTTGKKLDNPNQMLEMGDTLVGGITQADKALLMGIAKALSHSNSTKQQLQASELSTIIGELQ